MALDKLINEGSANFSNKPDVFKLLEELKIDSMTVGDKKNLHASIETIKKKIESSNFGNDGKFKDAISKAVSETFKKFGLDKKLESRIKKIEENTSKYLEEFEFLHKDDQQVSESNRKALMDQVVGELALLDEKAAERYKEQMEAATTAKEVSQIHKEALSLVSNEVINANKLINKNLSSMNNTLKVSSQAILAGTKEIMAPVFGVIGDVFSDVKDLIGFA